MSQGFEGILSRRWRGYELEPGEAEVGRAPVQSDVGGAYLALEAERLVLTDRRLLLLRSSFHPLWIVLALALTFVLHVSFFVFPLLVFGLLLLTTNFRRRIVAQQPRAELAACEIVPAASFVMKPKLALRFRDGAVWQLYNPAKSFGRLDAMVALLHKGGIEAAAAGAATRATGANSA